MTAPPCFVEIAGVAGAGKSALTRALCEDVRFRAGGFIHTRVPAHLVRVVLTLPRLTRILVAHPVGTPRMSWAEFKLLVYVTGWQKVLRREAPRDGSVTLLDQGPIYALVRLTAEEKPFTRGRAFGMWRRRMLDRWVRELSAMVWLDAPDGILWSRINDREQQHRKKGEPEEVGRRFIVRYRELFEEILERIESTGGPDLLRFDTSTTSIEELVSTARPLLLAVARSVAPRSPDGSAG